MGAIQRIIIATSKAARRSAPQSLLGDGGAAAVTGRVERGAVPDLPAARAGIDRLGRSGLPNARLSRAIADVIVLTTVCMSLPHCDPGP